MGGNLFQNYEFDFYPRILGLDRVKNMKSMGNFCMGDVGGYGIADYLPRVPFLPKGPVGPAGKKGTRGRS